MANTPDKEIRVIALSLSVDLIKKGNNNPAFNAQMVLQIAEAFEGYLNGS